MSDNDDERCRLMGRLYYLITIAAEDVAAMAAERQRRWTIPSSENDDIPANVRKLGEQIEILAAAIQVIGRNKVGDN